MAQDKYHAEFALIFEALDGLMPGRPITDQDQWRLLKAIQAMKSVDADVRQTFSAMGVEMPARPDPLRGSARKRLVDGENGLPEGLA